MEKTKLENAITLLYEDETFDFFHEKKPSWIEIIRCAYESVVRIIAKNTNKNHGQYLDKQQKQLLENAKIMRQASTKDIKITAKNLKQKWNQNYEL